MTYIRRSILFFLGFTALLTIHNTSFADESSAPYIYYYANTLNAIVVERADGADSRVIAPGAMPDNSLENAVIDDLDWSPPGEWMAWRSATATEFVPGAYSGWIARSDGSGRLTLLDNIGGNILKMEWSPIHDYLFVAHFANENQLRLMIIDPIANKIIAETTYDADQIISPYESVGGWLENGDGVYFGYDLLLITLTLDDRVQTTLYEDLPVPDEKYSVSQVINLQQGRLFYFDERGDSQYDAVLEDIQTGKRVVIDEAANLQTNYEVYWNPSMTLALIVGQSCPTNTCMSAPSRLLDWRTSTVAPLKDMTPTVEDTFEGVTPIWSPDGRFLIAEDSSISSLVIVDSDTRKIMPLPTSSYWQWGDPHTLFLIGYQDKVIYRYDADNNKLDTFDVLLPEVNYYSIWPSPSNMLIGVYNSLLHQGNVINLDTGKILTWPPHSLGTYGAIFATYTWSTNSQWFFDNEHISFAGGGGGPEAHTIINLDGTVRRELGVCFCAYGFVPDRALPHLGADSPVSVVKEPDYTLPHGGKVMGVAWNSDGSQIASYSLGTDYTAPAKISIWDVRDTPQLLHSYETDFGCVTFPAPCKLIWSADNNTITLTDYNKLAMVNVETGMQMEGAAPSNTGFSMTSRDGTAQFIENGDGTITVSWWGTEKSLILTVPSANVFSADVQPFGKYIFGASLYHRIYVWDAATGTPLNDLNFYAIDVALSPDGTRLAAAGSSLVTLWDVADLDTKNE